MKSFIPLVVLLISGVAADCQVNNIKRASANYNSSSSTSSEGDGSSSSSGGASFVSNVMVGFAFEAVIDAQRSRLQRRGEIPTTISLDLMFHSAMQPSSYYILHPRIRGTWGLFSTDFRMNYLIEDGIDGYIHIRTHDWQMIQLNIVSTRDFNARIGGGTMREFFEGDKSFFEWTYGMLYQPVEERWGGSFEYRGAEVRKEACAFMQYKLFDSKALHGFATGGVVYQRYYRSVTVWGIQGGLMLKVY